MTVATDSNPALLGTTTWRPQVQVQLMATMYFNPGPVGHIVSHKELLRNSDFSINLGCL